MTREISQRRLRNESGELMRARRRPRGLIDASVVIELDRAEPEDLPEEIAIAAVSLADLAARGRRALDLMIAATAAAAGLPLHTRNPSDFIGLDDIVEIEPVATAE